MKTPLIVSTTLAAWIGLSLCLYAWVMSAQATYQQQLLRAQQPTRQSLLSALGQGSDGRRPTAGKDPDPSDGQPPAGKERPGTVREPVDEMAPPGLPTTIRRAGELDAGRIALARRRLLDRLRLAWALLTFAPLVLAAVVVIRKRGNDQ